MAEPEVKAKISADASGVVQATAQASESMKRFGRSVNGIRQDLHGATEASRKLGEMQQKLGSQVRNVGLALTALGASATAVLAGMSKVALEFQAAMRNTNSIAKEADQTFRRTFETVAKFGPKLGTNKGPRELAEALYDINSSGFAGQEGLKVLAPVAKGASGGLTEAKEAATVLVQSLNSFGKGAESAQQFMDVMFRTVEKGVIDFRQLQQYLGQVTSAAKNTGISFEEVNAAVAVLTQRGSSPSSAVTGLRNVIQQLSAPTEEASKYLAAYGIQAGEAAIRSKGLVGVLQDLYRKTGGNKIALRRILGDVEGADAAGKLVGPDGGNLFQARIGDMQSAAGAMESALAEQRKAVLFQMQEIWAAVQGFAILGLQGLEPIVAPAVAAIKHLALAMLDLPQGAKTAIAGAAILAAGLATLAGAAIAVAPSIISMVASVKLAGGLAAVLTPVIGTITGVGAAFASAALPVTAAVVAIVAAGAALKHAWDRNWGGIQETTATAVRAIRHFLEDGFFRAKEALTQIWESTWSTLRTGWTSLMEGLKPVLQEGAAFVTQVWGLVKDDVSAALAFLVPAVKGTFGVLWNTIAPALVAIKEVFAVNFGAMREIATVAWSYIKAYVLTAVTAIRDIIRFYVALFQGDWQGAWDAMTQGFNNFGTNIMAGLRSVLSTMAKAWQDFIGTAFSAGERIQEAFLAGMQGREAAADAAGTEIAENGIREAAGDRFVDRAAASVQQAASNQEKVDALNALLAGAKEHSNPALLNAANISIRRLLGEENSKPKGEQDLAFMRQLGQLVQTMERLRVQIAAEQKAKRAAAAAAGKPEEPWTAPPELPDVSGSKGRKSSARRPLTRAEALAYVRQHAQNARDVDLEGLTLETLRATAAYVRNSIAAGLKVRINSTTRKTNTFHGSGQAVDFSLARERFSYGFRHGDLGREEGQIGKRLSAGTGFVSGIDEINHPSPHASGFHTHLTTGRERLPQEGGLPGAFLVPGGSGSGGKGAMQSALQQWLRDLEQFQKAYREYVVGPETEFQRRRREEEQKFQDLLRQADKANAGEEYLKRLKDTHARNLDLITEDERRANAIRTLQAQAQHQEFIGWHTAAERTRIRLESAQQIAALEEESRVRPDLAAENSRKVLEIRQAEVDKIREMEIRSQAEQAQRLLDLTEGKKVHQGDNPFAAALDRKQTDVTLGKASESDMLGFWEQQLNGWKGTEAKLREASVQFIQFYREHLQQQLQIQGQWNLEALRQHEQQLVDLGTRTTTQELELAATRQSIREMEIQQQQERMQVINQIGDTFQQFLVQTLSGQQSFSMTFQNLWKSLANTVISEIARMIVKTVAFQTILLGLRKLLGGIFGGIFHDGGLVGEASPAFLGPVPGTVVAHRGGLIDAAGRLLSYHTGGVVGAHLRPDEVLAKLQKGEIVLSRQDVRNLGDAGPGGGAPVFNLSFPGAVVREEMDLQRIANHVMDAMFRSQRSFLQGA